MLRWDLCDYCDAYIAVKIIISVRGTNDNNNKKSWLWRIMIHLDHAYQNKTFIDNAEDLDIVMPMYNLLAYSDNYSKDVWKLLKSY